MPPRKTLVTLLLLFLSAPALAQRTPGTTPNATRDSRRTDVPQQPPTNSAAQTGIVMQKTGGSLLQAQLQAAPDPRQVKASQISYIAVPEPEPKVLKKHDLVTIIVREESQISSKGTNDFKRSADYDAKIDSFVKLKVYPPAILPLTPSQNPAEIKMEGSRDFSGSGDLERTDSFVARITAEVLDVKPNGTLVLQARKRIKTDEEEQAFILTGTCRAQDITADNTVLSTQLYDLELQKNHKGDVRQATKRGWLPKLLDLVNPF